MEVPVVASLRKLEEEIKELTRPRRKRLEEMGRIAGSSNEGKPQKGQREDLDEESHGDR